MFVGCVCSSGVSRCRTDASPPFTCSSAAGPGTGCDRQLQCPGRLARHQTGEFFGAAEAVRHLGNDLIVHVQHDRIAGGFDAQHRLGSRSRAMPETMFSVHRPP